MTAARSVSEGRLAIPRAQVTKRAHDGPHARGERLAAQGAGGDPDADEREHCADRRERHELARDIALRRVHGERDRRHEQDDRVVDDGRQQPAPCEVRARKTPGAVDVEPHRRAGRAGNDVRDGRGGLGRHHCLGTDRGSIATACSAPLSTSITTKNASEQERCAQGDTGDGVPDVLPVRDLRQDDAEDQEEQEQCQNGLDDALSRRRAAATPARGSGGRLLALRLPALGGWVRRPHALDGRCLRPCRNHPGRVRRDRAAARESRIIATPPSPSSFSARCWPRVPAAATRSRRCAASATISRHRSTACSASTRSATGLPRSARAWPTCRTRPTSSPRLQATSSVTRSTRSRPAREGRDRRQGAHRIGQVGRAERSLDRRARRAHELRRADGCRRIRL